MPGRLLLMDPVTSTRIVLKTRLSACCYDVFSTETLDQALEIGGKDKPDLILLCEGNGAEISAPEIDHLRKHPRLRYAPILVIAEQDKPSERLALLEAGVEDVLLRSENDDLLMARLRILMRRKAVANEVVQRDSAQRQLTMAEAAPLYRDPGHVALVTTNLRRAEARCSKLSGSVPDTVHALSIEAALGDRKLDILPDVFVVTCGVGPRDPGLRLLSELRCRIRTRLSAVIVVMENPADADPEMIQERAIMALDIGAADVMLSGFEINELACRIKKQMTVKKRADHLRNSVQAGLRMAVCDPLTGLYNRRYAIPHLARIASAAQNRNAPFVTMLLDLDRFKLVNDTYGHPAGDTVLVAVAARLKENLRGDDLLARIGGEEFLIAMPETDTHAASDAANRLRDIIRQKPITLPGSNTEIHITCSIGVSVTAPGGTWSTPSDIDVEKLISTADEALYRSKAEGRDAITFARFAA